MLKRTPCVGICSTTYGDLVCRGCKRFAHEIVQWNAFDEQQRDAVWARLLEQRARVVAEFVELTDRAALQAGAARLNVPDRELVDDYNLVYELLRRLRRRTADEASAAALETFGLRPRQGPAGAGLSGAGLLELIDQELYQRALAYYERSFRTLVQ
ncbi:MAG: DUF1289 domain-containing protein [Pseudomonadales bacterium]